MHVLQQKTKVSQHSAITINFNCKILYMMNQQKMIRGKDDVFPKVVVFVTIEFFSVHQMLFRIYMFHAYNIEAIFYVCAAGRVFPGDM